MDSPGSSLFAVLALIAANAFLVAAEYALIAVRRIRIEHSARAGDLRAAQVLPALDRLEELVFAGQVGRSTASLLLGWYALRFGRDVLLPLLGPDRPVPVLGSTNTLAALLAVAIAVLLHATLGQQVPKLVAIHRAEGFTATVGVPVLRLMAFVLKPVLWPLSLLVHGLLRMLGVDSRRGFQPLTHTPEEIRMLVAHGADPHEIEAEEREMIRGVFEISETVAREVMTPRTAIVAVPVDVTFQQLVECATEEGHSRIPVYEGTIDTVVGVVLVKDLLPLLRDRARVEREGFDVRTIMRRPYFVPESKPVADILSELRLQSVHLAIVLDEFGGTYGLLTLEDLLEEIVGEINDEYDLPDPVFEPTPEGDTLIDGAAAVSEVNQRFGLRLPEDEFDTVGGYVFGTLGRVPVVGDVVAAAGRDGERELRVEEVEERRITTVRLSRPSRVPRPVPDEE